MARIGYARVSSVGQSLAVQLDKLSACDKIYQEKQSGATSQRPSLAACLDYVREGDTLVVTRLTGWRAPPCTCVRSPRSCGARASIYGCSIRCVPWAQSVQQGFTLEGFTLVEWI